MVIATETQSEHWTWYSTRTVFVNRLPLQQVTARDVQSSLIPILQTFHERSLYLNCLLNPATPSLAILQAGLKRKEDKKEEEKKENKGSKGTLKLVGIC